MKRRWVVIPVLVLAACSGGSNSGTPATSGAAATTAPTTAAPTTTETPTTTMIPASTTTEAATTTTISLEDEFQAIEAAFYVSYEACLSDPASCNPSAFMTDNALSAMETTLRDMLGFDLYAGPGPEPLKVVVGKASQISASVVDVEVCLWDTGVVYNRPDNEGDVPTVVNDEQATRWFTDSWVNQDGRWMLQRTVETRPKVVGVDQCGG